MARFADIADRLYGQPMFSLLDKANRLNRKVIHYEIGDPAFDTPENVVDKTVATLKSGHTHYVSSNGIDECRDAVCEYVNRYYNFKPSREQVTICMANAAIDFVCRLLANPGEEILYPDPGFSTYYSCIVYGGIVPAPVPLLPENGYVMTAGEIEKRLTEKSRLIILNSAQNPTGSVMTEEEVNDVFALAQKRDLYILSDEVYSRIIYEGAYKSPALCDFCKERVIMLGSLSKTYAMTGWRLGYVVSPEKFAVKLGLMIQTILSCMPNFLQYGMIEALLGDQREVEKRVAELKKRRDRLVPGLNGLKGVKCLMPKGAFYAFPYIGELCKDDKLYCDKLLEQTGICAIPGSFFGEYGKGHIRLCYASVTLEEIEETLKLLFDFHDKKGWTI